MLKDICKLLEVEGVNKDTILQALNNDEFYDFEDCLQMECAASFGAGYIVTRNIKDFANSNIPAIEPDELIRQLQEL